MKDKSKDKAINRASERDLHIVMKARKGFEQTKVDAGKEMIIRKHHLPAIATFKSAKQLILDVHKALDSLGALISKDEREALLLKILSEWMDYNTQVEKAVAGSKLLGESANRRSLDGLSNG